MASVNMDREAVETQRSHAPQRLTEDEERILRQCTKEAFLYRGIPLGAAFLAGTVWAGRMGYLKPGGTRTAFTGGFNTNFQHTTGYAWRPVLMVEEEPRKTAERTTDPQEATGKLSHIPTLAEYVTRAHTDRAGLVFCYVAGNMSYAKQCRQKVQTLIPDSNLARTLREKFADKTSHLNQEFVPDQSPTYFPSQGATGKEVHREEIHSGRQAPGLDDSLRPTIDNNVIGISRREEQPKDDRVYTTYDELRKRNREGHRNRRSSLSGIPVDHSEDSHQPTTPPGQKEPGFFDKNVTRKKNEYGDDWED